MIPGGGCGRLAQINEIEAEIHAVSRVLQVALIVNSYLPEVALSQRSFIRYVWMADVRNR